MGLTACVYNDEPVIYSQLTKDDLSYLHYNKDTFISTGKDVVYKDTLNYILNNIDTLNITVTTKIYSIYDNPFFTYYKSISGRSLISFNKSTGFNYANILVSRLGNRNSEKFFEIDANGTWGYSKQYFSIDTFTLDTALVLGKLYQNVYKFYPPEEGKSDIRLIFFAKKYGYIKIEKLDGTKIELIDRSK